MGKAEETKHGGPAIIETVFAGLVFFGGKVAVNGVEANPERAVQVLSGEETLLIEPEIDTITPNK